MRCSLCQELNPAHHRHCASCGARLLEDKHRELAGIAYLLGQVAKWDEEKRYGAGVVASLREEYGAKRDALKSHLSPAKPAPVLPRPADPSPLAAPATLPALRVAPMRPVRPVAPLLPPPPPKPPFSWKNLYTERNIRWVLNLGIFIFSVALAVFIHTQWREMAPGLKVGILYGASFAAIGAGHLLRRTMLKATGMALILLGAIAIPIDCAALLAFRLVSPEHSSQVGLGGSILSLAVYLALARLYGENRFIQLATLAGTSAWAFLLRTCGAAWEAVLPWTAPFALAGVVVGRRPVRLLSTGILGASLLGTIGLLACGLLSAGKDALALEVALASGVAGAILAERRTGISHLRWGTAALLGGMYAVAAGHAGRPFGECWLSLAALGAAFGGGWIRKSPPFIAAGLLASALSLLSAAPDLGRLAAALAIPAALHAALGFARNDDRHAFAGWLLAGLALLSEMGAHGVPRLWQPLVLAGYGALMIALSHRRTPRAFHLLGVLGAGGAMFLLAAGYPGYYLPRPFPMAAAPPGGQLPQLLGAAVALVSALAFGPLANALRSRFVSDITYACLGFSYILALRWAGVPGAWLGLSVALFGLAYALLEKRISRWLLRPTLFTGIACTVAAGAFAFLQWFSFREYLQSALTLLLVGGFYLAVAERTPYKALFHVGTYLATGGWLVGLQALGVFPEARALATLIPAGLALVVAARRRELHLGLAALVVSTGALAITFLDPAMYAKERLPYAIAASLAAAVLSGGFAFSKALSKGLDDRVMSGLMGVFASTAYVLWLKSMSTGSAWGGLVLFQMTTMLCVAAELLRRRGFVRQAIPLVLVSFATTGLALFACHERGFGLGVHLWGYALAFVLYTLLGRTFRREEFGWAGALAGGAGLVFWLLHWETPWIGVWTFPIAALALLKDRKPLLALGGLGLLLCPAHAAVSLYGEELPWAGLVLAGMAASLAGTRLRPFSLYPMILGIALSARHPEWGMWVALSGFAVYLAVSLAKREPAYIYAALALALLGDYLLALQHEAHAGLVAYPLALVLFAMAREAGKRFGDRFAWPLLGAGFAAALLATMLAFPLENDRILVFLADALLFGASAALFRRPELMYPCSAALVALDIALMWKFQMRPTLVAFQLLSLALGKVIFVRVMGERLKDYLKPVYVASLLIAGGVLAFGFAHHEAYTARDGDINLAVWGLMLIALTAGIAGRIRKIPAFLYLAAMHLLAAYYLALYKYRIETTECFTLPIAAGLVIWSALGIREKGGRALVETLAAGFFFLPSALQSFAHDRSIHTLYALGLAFGTVLLGMAMKRRILLFGGTGAFVAEVLGKVVQYLVERDLPAAGWGMILGGLMILLAAVFESRKVRRVHAQFELLKVGARRYFATWE